MIGPWRRADLAETRCTLLEGQLAEAHHTIRSLSDMIADMKREGFASPPKFDPPGDAADSLPDEVLDAMVARAQPNTRAWNLIGTEARKMLRHGDPKDVAQKILEGEPGAFSW